MSSECGCGGDSGAAAATTPHNTRPVQPVGADSGNSPQSAASTLVVVASSEELQPQPAARAEATETEAVASAAGGVGRDLNRPPFASATADTACQVELLQAREFERLAEELAEANRLRLSYVCEQCSCVRLSLSQVYSLFIVYIRSQASVPLGHV